MMRRFGNNMGKMFDNSTNRMKLTKKSNIAASLIKSQTNEAKPYVVVGKGLFQPSHMHRPHVSQNRIILF